MKSIPSVRLPYSLLFHGNLHPGEFNGSKGGRARYSWLSRGHISSWRPESRESIANSEYQQLVASSTVGVAATGLVFGQPTSTPTRPASNKRKATEYDAQHRSFSSPLVRPATSSVISTPLRGPVSASSPIQPSDAADYRFASHSNAFVDTPINRSRRVGSESRFGETLAIQGPASEEQKDSISSRGSWMRRLSIIPTSHHGSPGSSVGSDSPSLTCSHGFAAHVPPSGSSPAHLQPNKLVKRTASVRGLNGNSPSRPASNQRIPTLRRPATSHQRSVTLQQQYRDDEMKLPSTPSDHEDHPVTIINEFAPSVRRTFWRPYFEAHPTRLAKERPSTVSNATGIDSFYSTSARVPLPNGSALPTLMKPSMIEGFTTLNKVRNRYSVAGVEGHVQSPDFDSSGVHTSDQEFHKRPRQSISLHFSSPTNWISKSNSLRISMVREFGRGNGHRTASAPISATPARAATSHGGHNHRRGDILDPSIYQEDFPELSHPEHSKDHFQTNVHYNRARGISSPLPPISRLSSFNLDLSGLHISSSSNSHHGTHMSPTSPDNIRPISRSTSDGRFKALTSHPVVVHQQFPPRLSELNASDRGSTLVGSDSDAKGFASGEDDEMDFQSDTAYDSYRTGATASLRARNATLDSMFDESPPSSGARSKISEFHEMALISAFRNTDDSIVEEDEGMVTPIKSRRRFNEDTYSTPIRQSIETATEDIVPSSPPSFCLATREFSRLSLGDDDDEEEDWTRDDDSIALRNSLSPPTSSINSQRVSKALCAALADVTDTGASVRNGGQIQERPRSVFDWSEPHMHEKVDIMGNCPRPSTVHGKQGMDSRGGRAAGRSRPTALHVRSQSVPVVPDIGGHRESKVAPKFGTWGLGAKNVSEDWDNDFEFDNMDTDEGNGQLSTGNSVAMLVPPAIQASQANVVGHVGQIREVCLLVEDLKRLRSLAREKGILDGPSADKWREAEGIIALAIPDEEDETLSPPQSPSTLSRERGHQSNHRTTMSIDSTDRNGFENEDIQENGHDDLYHNFQSRRQSVFSPDDDIFGSALPSVSVEETRSTKNTRRYHAGKDTTEIARSVMENMHQHRASSDPIHSTVVNDTPDKMPFDTTSLRDLVQRANALARALSEIIRRADGITQSPNRSPHFERDSSPAFTRVFSDPLASPPRSMMHRTQSNNSVLSATIDSSPTRNLGQRMQMMTVV